ncbi:MAG: radical SAM protein [Chloroflexi bacterium]|nr:MAG: radical SAM protein [Chloroflexota bacterium]
MNILLIEPAKAPRTIGGEDVFLYEPLALEYLAAGVSRDHDVTILDLRLEKDLRAAMARLHPDVVGITSYTVHVNTVRKLFRQIKAWNPQVLTVVGGHHATVAPQDFASPDIDVIVMGEGVFPFQEILARYERGEGFDGVPGVALAENGALSRTEPLPVIDLDTFPLPDRRLTAGYRSHYFSEWMRPLASIRTSKGCPHRCKFCALWKLAGGRYLKRSPDKVVEELAGLDEEFVFFSDDESLVDAPRMKTMARLIREAGIRKRYFLYGRSDTIARNPGLLELWREVGLERVFVGLEFFRDEDLKDIRKGSTVSDNEGAVKVLQDLGIDIYASFIVRPEFTRADFDAFRSYCRALDLDFATFAMLTPLPGTDFYEEVRERMISHDYDYFDFIHTLLPTALPLKDFYEEYYQLYQKATPLARKLAMLRKMQWRDVPGLVASSQRVFRQLRKAYQDYD